MNFIKEWRDYRGLSQQALGEALDPPASPGTISSYETGSRKTSQRRLAEIADVLGTTPGRLLDTPPPKKGEPDPVPAEVVNIWDRMPLDRRDEAISLWKVIADRKQK